MAGIIDFNVIDSDYNSMLTFNNAISYDSKENFYKALKMIEAYIQLDAYLFKKTYKNGTFVASLPYIENYVSKKYGGIDDLQRFFMMFGNFYRNNTETLQLDIHPDTISKLSFLAEILIEGKKKNIDYDDLTRYISDLYVYFQKKYEQPIASSQPSVQTIPPPTLSPVNSQINQVKTEKSVKKKNNWWLWLIVAGGVTYFATKE